MGGPNPGGGNARQRKAQMRRKMVWELCLEGLNYWEIAAKVEERYKRSSVKNVDDLPKNWNHKKVSVDIKRSLENTKSDVMSMSKHHLEVQVQRIERMISSIWEKVMEDEFSGDKIDAINTINRLQKRKSKLLGLNDPEKIEMITEESADEDDSFEWPDPEDAPQLKHRENGDQDKVHTNGHENGEVGE